MIQMTSTEIAGNMVEAYGSAKAAIGEAWLTYNRMWRNEDYTQAELWAGVAHAIAAAAK